MTRIAIIGSRPEEPRVLRGTSPEQLRDNVRRMAVHAMVNSLPADTVLVSGGAEGADRWAEQQAHGKLIVVSCRPAWDTQGKSAGHRRNAVIAEIADRCVAFFGAGESRGTEGCVALFRKLGKPVEEWRFREDGTYGKVTEPNERKAPA